MPVTEVRRTGRGPRDGALLAELIAELRSPRANGQPAIEIREMARGLRHVYVIWDRWDGCEPESRGEIVRSAFREVHGPDYERAIAVTFPATVPEAADMGLLPFQVKPLAWDEAPSKLQGTARQMLLARGASVLGNPDVPALCFRTAEQATEAIRLLKSRVPGVEWYVVETRFVAM